MAWIVSAYSESIGGPSVVDPGPQQRPRDTRKERYLLGPGSKGFSRKGNPSGLKLRARKTTATDVGEGGGNAGLVSLASIFPEAIANLIVADSHSISHASADEAVVRERQRIARNLHDHAGQYLVGISMRLKALELHATDPALHDSLRDLRTMVARFGDELKATCDGERCGVPRGDSLVAALVRMVDEWESDVGVPVKFDHHVTDSMFIDDDTAEAVFRLVQEALTNVAKYAAHSSRVRVLLQVKPGSLKIEVEDDGLIGRAGVKPKAPGERRGCGISGMRERIAQLGGRFNLNHVAGAGTKVAAVIPLNGVIASAEIV
jgi:signal transduction histidine kinase